MTGITSRAAGGAGHRVLLSRENLRAYTAVLLGIIVVVVAYRLLLGPASARGYLGGPPPPGPPPRDGTCTYGRFDSWPLWGQLVLPGVRELMVAVPIAVIAAVCLGHLNRREGAHLSVWQAAVVGTLSIIATSLVHGWDAGIVQPIAGPLELFTDLPRVVSIVDFISNYEELQPTLTVHAQTQPPGAVLLVYVLYRLVGSPGAVAIAICVLAAIGSAFFIRGILVRLLGVDEETAAYAVLLYLLLPAVQVYYLANVYAVVATLVSGVVYFYLYEDRRVAFLGSSVCLFLLTFITFLSVFAVLLLFTFEGLRALAGADNNSLLARMASVLRPMGFPLLVTASVGGVYLLLFVTTGFNYVDAFLYASSLENPGGFMLVASPVEYVVTRVQDVMDILVFLGPAMCVLTYRGLVTMRGEAVTGGQFPTEYSLVKAALLSLALLFLAGTPKKGETARICMFVLPFLLVPVLTYIMRTDMSRRESRLLLAIVFAQAVVFQLFGMWVW